MTAGHPVVQTSAGPAVVLHRLALAVELLDATTGGAAVGSIARRELPGWAASRVRASRSRRLDALVRDDDTLPLESHGEGRFVLRHAFDVGSRIVLQVGGAGRSWVARRISTTLWLAEVPAESRHLVLWVYPGIGSVLPAGTTGAKLRLVRGHSVVPWARAEVFGPGGAPVTWAYGDADGQMLVVVRRPAAAVAGDGSIDVAVRLHVPPDVPPAPGAAPPVDPSVSLELPPLDTVPRPPRVPPPPPPPPPPLIDDTARGCTVPIGYATVLQEIPLLLPLGEVVAVPDITVP